MITYGHGGMVVLTPKKIITIESWKACINDGRIVTNTIREEYRELFAGMAAAFCPPEFMEPLIIQGMPPSALVTIGSVTSCSIVKYLSKHIKILFNPNMLIPVRLDAQTVWVDGQAICMGFTTELTVGKEIKIEMDLKLPTFTVEEK